MMLSEPNWLSKLIWPKKKKLIMNITFHNVKKMHRKTKSNRLLIFHGFTLVLRVFMISGQKYDYYLVSHIVVDIKRCDLVRESSLFLLLFFFFKHLEKNSSEYNSNPKRDKRNKLIYWILSFSSRNFIVSNFMLF